MRIGFIGFGELGKQFSGFIDQLNENNDFVFFDDNLFNSSPKNIEVYKFSEYETYKHKIDKYYIALGYKHLATKDFIIKKLIDNKQSLGTFIHPTTYINPSAEIESGCFIYPMCNIDKEVKLDAGVLINNSVTVSHNCTIGSSCYLSPGVTLSGNVIIGAGTFLGTGSIVSNGVSIGKNVVIGIGSVVTQDIPDNAHVIGNPARILNKKLNIL